MMRFALTDAYGETVIVAVRLIGGDRRGRIEYEGCPAHVEPVRWDVMSSCGVRARRLGDRTTPAELAYAMRASPLLRRYRPRRLDDDEDGSATFAPRGDDC